MWTVKRKSERRGGSRRLGNLNFATTEARVFYGVRISVLKICSFENTVARRLHELALVLVPVAKDANGFGAGNYDATRALSGA